MHPHFLLCAEPPSFAEPVILRRGATVADVCKGIHRDFADSLKYGLVWVRQLGSAIRAYSSLANQGTSVKHTPQRVGPKHELEDEDVVQLVLK